MDAERAAMDADPTEPGPAETPASGLIRRVVSFDVGDRRIGVAVSDPLGYTAQPLFTLHRTGGKGGHRADMKSIARLLRKHAVAEAVVGNPLYMSGDQSPQVAKAQQFADDLRAQFGPHRASVGRAADSRHLREPCGSSGVRLKEVGA